jgi:hypothetical protein
MYGSGEFPSAKKVAVKMKAAVGLCCSKCSMQRILKIMGFQKCNNGKKLCNRMQQLFSYYSSVPKMMYNIKGKLVELRYTI